MHEAVVYSKQIYMQTHIVLEAIVESIDLITNCSSSCVEDVLLVEANMKDSTNNLMILICALEILILRFEVFSLACAIWHPSFYTMTNKMGKKFGF